jgi:hypothetical protein
VPITPFGYGIRDFQFQWGLGNSLIRFHFPPQAAGVVAPKETLLSVAKWKGVTQKLPEI